MKRKAEQLQRYLCEVEVTEGLEAVTIGELRERFGRTVEVLPAPRAGEIQFNYSGHLGVLRSLQTAYAVYMIYTYDVPRPRGLLGDAHFRRLLEQIELVRNLSPNTYRSFSIAAAGSESTVMSRIKADIAARTGLQLAEDKGDLLIRIRPRQGMWETLVRLSARPLVTRAWRSCNWEGALNAATAHAMIRLLDSKPDDVFLNLGCGSGTFLIERLNYGSARRVIGMDSSDHALQCAKTNIGGAGEADIQLVRGDMRALPFPEASIDQVMADLPFGQLTGSHAVNVELYPHVLREAARITRPDGQFVFITHEMRLMDRLLQNAPAWKVEQSIQINLRGLHPRVYVLRRHISAL
jgi:tRNA (guanine6-N2)-methyltransferase